MRIVIATGVLLAGLAQTDAQTVLDGPLASPGTAVSYAKQVVKKAKKSPRHTAAKTRAAPAAARETPDRAGPPGDVPVATQSTSTKSDDPLSLGMKWNGSNDNGSQTRVQNYNGTAAGTGAEVGLKLHF